MNNSQKTSLFIIKIVLTLHFIFLFLYCLPDGVLNEGVKGVVSSYANPLFQGRWNLFAPEVPKEHKSLVFRYKIEQEFSQWIQLSKETKEEHDAKRIGASTKMYHVLQNGSHYLWEFYYQNNTARDSIKLRNMQHLLFQKIKNENGKIPNEIEMALFLKSSPDFYTGEITKDTLYFDSFKRE